MTSYNSEAQRWPPKTQKGLWGEQRGGRLEVLNFLLSETPQSLSVGADLGACRENGVDSGGGHGLLPPCREQQPSVQVSEVTALRMRSEHWGT